MNLQQLQCFKTMANLLHYTRAADVLYISQATLSYTISELEKELGVSLFEKVGRQVRLTSYGTVFLAYAEKMLNTADDGKAILKEMANPMQGTVRIGYFPSLLAGFLPEFVKSFTQSSENKGITLQLLRSQSTSMEQSLLNNELDVAFSTIAREAGLISTPICRHKMVLLVSSQHALAKAEEASVKDIRDDAIILLWRRPQMRQDQEAYFQKVGFEPKTIIEATSFASLLDLVEAGVGVSLAPMRPDLASRAVHPLKLAGEPFYREICLLHVLNKIQRPVVDRFIDFTKEMYKTEDGFAEGAF